MSPSALPPLLFRHWSCPRAEERKNGSTFLGVPRSHSPLLCSSMPSRRPTLLVAFLSLEARTRDPLVRLSIFRLRTLTGADTCGLLFGASLGPTLFILTLYLQNVLGYSPVLTGFAFLPHALIVTFPTNLVSRWTTRLGVKPGMVTGAVVLAVGLFWLSRMSAHDQYWASSCRARYWLAWASLSRL